MDDAHSAAITGHYTTHKSALTQCAVDRAVESDVLLDAEWRFGVTVSTDDVGRVGSSFVQLRLLTSSTSAGGGGGAAAAPQEHALELTVPQFYNLLASLEKAQGYCNLLGAIA